MTFHARQCFIGVCASDIGRGDRGNARRGQTVRTVPRRLS
jgi:hypothetical protein